MVVLLLKLFHWMKLKVKVVEGGLWFPPAHQCVLGVGEVLERHRDDHVLRSAECAGLVGTGKDWMEWGQSVY